VFLLACAIAAQPITIDLILCFIVLHFFIYPASNGYNSYFDKDEKSIGGLKNPPSVAKELYWISLLFDFIGLAISWFISIEFMVMILIYGLVSKAYSHPSIRLKKYPIAGWLAAGVFQGYFTYLMSIMAIMGSSFIDSFTQNLQLPGILSSVLLLGSYPMTQIYQHHEDAERGDFTISRMLGVINTFHFTALIFTISTIGFAFYFKMYFGMKEAILFPVFLIPVLYFFTKWYFRARKNLSAVDYESTMRLNFLSALVLNAFFSYLWLS